MDRRNIIPDFIVDGWRFVKRIDYLAVDFFGRGSLVIGEYWFYINERTAELGYVVYDKRSKKICIVWQKKIWNKGTEKLLSYIAYRKKDKWIVRRLQDILIVSVLKKDNKINELTIIYDAITGERQQFILDLT